MPPGWVKHDGCASGVKVAVGVGVIVGVLVGVPGGKMPTSESEVSMIWTGMLEPSGCANSVPIKRKSTMPGFRARKRTVASVAEPEGPGGLRPCVTQPNWISPFATGNWFGGSTLGRHATVRPVLPMKGDSVTLTTSSCSCGAPPRKRRLNSKAPRFETSATFTSTLNSSPTLTAWSVGNTESFAWPPGVGVVVGVEVAVLGGHTPGHGVGEGATVIVTLPPSRTPIGYSTPKGEITLAVVGATPSGVEPGAVACMGRS